MTLYHTPQSSCCIQIVKVRYQGPDYFKATIRYYSKPGLTLLFEEKNVKIMNASKKFWNVYK